MMKISVIGCGWLGLPLAKELLKIGHVVNGSTTQPEKELLLQAQGIQPFHYDGTSEHHLPSFVHESEVVIINFPPSRSYNYAEQIALLLQQFNNTSKIIFTSSIGVYQDVEGSVNEHSALFADHPVVLGESAVVASGKSYCILRLAGLIGADRHPVKNMSGRTIENGNMRVNLIHRNDVINAIIHLLDKDQWNKTYNICSGEHPSKSDYYSAEANKLGIPAPTFTISEKIGKLVLSDKIQQELGFRCETSIFSA